MNRQHSFFGRSLLSVLFCGMVLFGTQIAFARDFAVKDVKAEIARFNASVAKENPAPYKTKLTAMKMDAFSFLRGTAHLMVADIRGTPSLAFLNAAPQGLIQGDQHVHNFSVLFFPGKSATYGLDDMDEAHTGPLSWDLFRLCVSLRVGVHDAEDKDDRSFAVDQMIDGYLEGCSRTGDPDWPGCTMPKFLREFVVNSSKAGAEGLLKKWAKGIPGQFKRSGEVFPVPPQEFGSLRKALVEFFAAQARSRNIPKAEVGLLDVVIREGKGLSSIGLRRYFALLQGENIDGSRARIIEIKQMRPSCVGPATLETQGRDTLAGFAAAHRDRDVFLGTFVLNGKRFLVRELFPWAERFEVRDLEKNETPKFAKALGAISADFHAQNGKGAAMKAWLEANREGFTKAVKEYAKQVREDWKTFSKNK
ncbi:MAG: DUF2252 family protein [Candidatus Ozemobacteraceae bacterium]